MSCINEEQIQYYLDDESGKEEKEAIGQHIENCPRCKGAMEQQRRRILDVKQSLDLLVTEQPVIPEFRLPVKTYRQRKIIAKYMLPMAVAASLLLIVFLRPLFESDKPPANGQSAQFMMSIELDANKPVTEYPLNITIVAPDGSISQTTIN